ncbi:MAG: hypothetical protein HY975_02365 [Candidatus Kerfeldbacteria bacterium]|nr:hypothetical protein [Candidatus Kerfeldbacteria bacterium]
MKLYKRLAIIVGIGLIGGILVVELPHAARIAHDPLVVEMSDIDLAKNADQVVSGTITKKLNTVREVGADGEDMVYTRWQVRTTRTVKGTHGQTVNVRIPGGRYLSTIVEVEDQPDFSVGQSVMLFLGKRDDWKGDYRLVGEFQGAFRLEGTGVSQEAVQSETGRRVKASVLEQVAIDSK